MGQRILVLGESGTGKSTSLRNFKADEIKLIKVINKNLPFRGQFDETVISDNATKIIQEMAATKKKVIVIDDAQYIMSNEFFRRAKESGWDKYNDIAANFFKVLMAVDVLPDDVFVYFLAHQQKDENGIEKIKTIGKVLDEKLTIEGLFTVVLKTCVCDGVYSFQTQNTGSDTCKSPIGMFSNFLIDNDLKAVDSIIREYWGYSKEKHPEVAIAEHAPSLRSPKPILMPDAKSHVLKTAPVIEASKPDEKKVEQVKEQTAEPEQKQELQETIEEQVSEQVQSQEPVKPVIQEQPTQPANESNEDKMARILAKLKLNANNK